MPRNKYTKNQKRIRNLEDICHQMSSEIDGLIQDQKRDSEEQYYLREFLRYKGLSEEYAYFRQNAHEVQDDDLPFLYLTL